MGTTIVNEHSACDSDGSTSTMSGLAVLKRTAGHKSYKGAKSAGLQTLQRAFASGLNNGSKGVNMLDLDEDVSLSLVFTLQDDLD